MSHYTVAVITKTGSEDEVRTLLAPFDENIEMSRYFEIWTQKSKEAFWLKYMGDKPYDESKLKELYDEHGGDWDGNQSIFKDDGTIEYWSTYNRNAKWDWYQVGGRWSGELIRTKDGVYCDEAKLSDVDFTIDTESERWQECFEAYNIWMKDGEPETKEEKDIKRQMFYKKEYYTSRYKDAADYANDVCGSIPHALLLPTGEWLEPGKMGWWGFSHASIEDEINFSKNYFKYLEPYMENYYITIVDCHI